VTTIEALKDARNLIAYMLEHGEWYSAQERLDAIDAALAAHEAQPPQQEPTP
jgi:hypothetical protein